MNVAGVLGRLGIGVPVRLNPFDRHGFAPSRTGKLRLEAGFFRETPDPERGLWLGAISAFA
jgi:hypothetical protein